MFIQSPFHPFLYNPSFKKLGIKKKWKNLLKKLAKVSSLKLKSE